MSSCQVLRAALQIRMECACWPLLFEGRAPPPLRPLPLPREPQGVGNEKAAHTTWNKSALQLAAVRVSRITSRMAIRAPVGVRVCLQ